MVEGQNQVALPSQPTEEWSTVDSAALSAHSARQAAVEFNDCYPLDAWRCA